MARHAGWQVFKQLVLESRQNGSRQAVPEASTAGAAASGGSSLSPDTQGSDGQMQALQDQARKLRLQVS